MDASKPEKVKNSAGLKPKLDNLATVPGYACSEPGLRAGGRSFIPHLHFPPSAVQMHTQGWEMWGPGLRVGTADASRRKRGVNCRAKATVKQTGGGREKHKQSAEVWQGECCAGKIL